MAESMRYGDLIVRDGSGWRAMYQKGGKIIEVPIIMWTFYEKQEGEKCGLVIDALIPWQFGIRKADEFSSFVGYLGPSQSVDKQDEWWPSDD